MEGCIQINGTAVQSCRHGQHLEGGARLVAVGHAAVTPLLQPGCIQRIGIAFRPFQSFQLRSRICIVDFQVIVGVVAAQSCHRQDLPGFGIHHQAEGTVLHIIAINGSAHLLFQTGLDRGIDGQHQGAALPVADEILIGKGHIHFVVALGSDDPSGRAGEIGIVGRLHPLRAFVGEVGEADDLGCQGAHGVIPFGIGLQMDARNALFVNEAADPSGSFLIDSRCYLLIADPVIQRLLPDPLRVLPQNFPQLPGDLSDIRLGLLQLPGVEIYILHRHIRCQQVHIPVVDIAPAGSDRGCPGLIAQGQSGIVIIIDDHQVVQPPEHQQHTADSQDSHDQHQPDMLGAVQAHSFVGLLFGLSSHHAPTLSSIAKYHKRAARETLAAHCSSYSTVCAFALFMRTGR